MIQLPIATLNVASLPSYGFGHRSLMWWGTMGMIAIEVMAFALAAVMYVYLWSQSQTWPLSSDPPDLVWGTLNLLVLVLSALPNHWTKRAAERHDLRKVRIGLVVCLALHGLFVISLVAAVTATLRARRHLRVRESVDADRAGANEPFLAFVALFFSLLIAAFWLTQWLMSPCL